MSEAQKDSFLKKWWEKRKQKAQEKKASKPKTLKEKVIENVKVFFSAYAIAFFIRLFLIEGYQIPSQSMVPSLRVNDILMVEKLSMGALFPLTRWKVPGFTKPRPNDIIVFVSPDWESPGKGKEFISLITLSLINLDNTFYNPKNLVKRLVAIPGDRIAMTNQMLIINGKPVNTLSLGSKSEVIYTQGVKNRTPYTYNLYEEQNDNYKRVVQHMQGVSSLIWRDGSVYREADFIQGFEERYRDVAILEFPEIIVPKKGVKVNLVSANPYYRFLMMKLIERESGKDVTLTADGQLVLEGNTLTEWIPQDDYYFGMGDNRDNSQDCRYFGFIPGKNIFGRIMFRYFPFHRFGFNVNGSADKIMKIDFTK